MANAIQFKEMSESDTAFGQDDNEEAMDPIPMHGVFEKDWSNVMSRHQLGESWGRGEFAGFNKGDDPNSRRLSIIGTPRYARNPQFNVSDSRAEPGFEGDTVTVNQCFSIFFAQPPP